MLEKTFREVMERHKRVDSWITAGVLCGVFFYALWINSVPLNLASFVLILILPYEFPKPKKKIKFINECIEWEIVWCIVPPYSKLISWFIVAIGFLVVVRGAWKHNLLYIFAGRFGYRGAIESQS